MKSTAYKDIRKCLLPKRRKCMPIHVHDLELRDYNPLSANHNCSIQHILWYLSCFASNIRLDITCVSSDRHAGRRHTCYVKSYLHMLADDTCNVKSYLHMLADNAHVMSSLIYICWQTMHMLCQVLSTHAGRQHTCYVKSSLHMLADNAHVMSSLIYTCWQTMHM